MPNQIPYGFTPFNNMPYGNFAANTYNNMSEIYQLQSKVLELEKRVYDLEMQLNKKGNYTKFSSNYDYQTSMNMM